MSQEVLDLFHPAVARWFRESYAAPTPAQAGGWPRIAEGRSTLILAPTGSGKTLAAFLYAIDEILRHGGRGKSPRGVHTLYLSPLRALATDIERNLSAPLEGISRVAEAMDLTLPEITVGMRTGDTPQSARQRMVRKPPSMLITTPESLHLILTSPRAREMLRTVRYVIVDEIHAMAPSKRGSFLTLLLERLEAMVPEPPVRIGLSATQRPLDRVASFLGGFDRSGQRRPVAIVDAGMRKAIDLGVVSPVEDMTVLPMADDVRPSIWPAIYEQLLGFVEDHTSTLIFANNRRAVERIAEAMNALAGHRLVRAHHGSVSKDERQRIETDLKAGRLPALVATSSLELGIDIGAIDLVCQVEAPYSVASAMQRVGRAGHLVRQTSKGRLIPKTRDDLLRMAATARAMQRGEISAVRIPRNALDVLAQQIVAMVAVEVWPVDALFERIRCADPYHDLPKDAFFSVLDLLAGRHRTGSLSGLRPKIVWERASQMLHPLPGTRHAAIRGGGTIPDTGQYPMVLEDGKTRLGELDEEFVFERRVGETVILGTGRWKILKISHDRVVVAPSDEPEAQMPFWKGEGLGHDAEFGQRFGAFLRDAAARLDEPGFREEMEAACALDRAAAENLVAYLRTQVERGGVIPNDRTILVDAFPNEAGDLRIAILSTYGRAFHLALWLGVSAVLRREGKTPPAAVFSNAGILLRPGTLSVDQIVTAIHAVRAEEAEALILDELAATPYFAARFRRNAVRALLLPRSYPGKRIPLWLQRLRAHDLLREAGQRRDFPMVTETYREIVEDILPMDELRRVLGELAIGESRVVVRKERVPSPFSSSLLLDFTAHHLYQGDQPAPPAQRVGPDREAVGALLHGEGVGEGLLDPEASAAVESRVQGTAPFHRARDGIELVELLQRIGDLTESEVAARCEPAALDALRDLEHDGRILRTTVQGSSLPVRWIAASDADRYRQWNADDLADLVSRFTGSRAPVSRRAIEDRYPGSGPAIDRLLVGRRLVEVPLPGGEAGVGDPEMIAGIRRMTLSRRRRRVRVSTPYAYCAFLLARHGVLAPHRGEDVLRGAIDQLAGCAFTAEGWRDVLSVRVQGFREQDLEELVRRGDVGWIGRPAGGRRRIVLLPADAPLWAVIATQPEPLEEGGDRDVLAYLASAGASFLHRMAADLERKPSEVAEALWRLTWLGRVTQDSLRTAWGPPPDPSRWTGSRSRSPWGSGRWSVVPKMAGEGEEITRAILRTLLDRYGVLCREWVDDDAVPLRWREAYPILSRMEWAGEVDRGLFVSGLTGPQFAARGVAASLDVLGTGQDAAGRAVRVHVEDPVNVYGTRVPLIRSDGEPYTVRRVQGHSLVLAGGRPVLAVESRGERLIPLAQLERHELAEALSTLAEMVQDVAGPASLRVRTWDGAPIAGTPAGEELERLGFMREDQSMILYRTYREAA